MIGLVFCSTPSNVLPPSTTETTHLATNFCF
uniref:Anthranilate synthase beta subunit, putative n=1 Tax=Arundo donax TaxID=35708 RepID=A0A0A8YSQ1_ARUDO